MSSTEENNESIISRLPWREYLRKIALKVVMAVIILTLFLLIVYYSRQINPNGDLERPTNIIGVFDFNHIMAIILSSMLFLFVLGAFIKTLFMDNKDVFGIDFKTKKTVFLFLLVVSFISAVYVLLDVALKNIYMTLGPIDVIWAIDNVLHISLPTITASTDRLAYAQIRTYYFFVFYVFMLLFPIAMFISLLTRYGRNKVFKKEEHHELQKHESHAAKAFALLISPLVLVFLINMLSSPDMTGPSFIIVATLIVIIVGWWLFEIGKLIYKGLKVTAFFSYANMIIFFPMVFLFYILPILFWTGWDFFMIYSMNGSTAKTIHTELGSPLANTVINLSALSVQDFFGLLVQTILVNAVAIVRIIQLDFVFVVAVSAIAIGFAEGYSIISIFSALIKGVSIARTGRIATKSAPKLIVMASRIIMLGAWCSFFWDRFIVLIGVLQNYFSIYFPFVLDIHLPRIFDYFKNIHISIDLSLLGFVLPLSLLLIPLYYILMSSFKFLSVSLIVDKTKNDQQIYFLLISSAFVLITTNILQDITASIMFSSTIIPPPELDYLPTSFATAQFLISFANKIFELVESLSFLVGLIVALVLLIKNITKKVHAKRIETEIKGRQKLYGSV